MVFPRHDIDAKQKDKQWILQYAKAAWEDSKTVGRSIFYHGRNRLREFRDYAMGNQSVTRYKNLIQPDDANGRQAENFIQLDYTVIPFIPRFRKIALGKLGKTQHNIVATAIDPLARDHEAEFFAEQKAKIMLLKELADIPNIQQMLGFEEGEPQSLEELEIKMQYSYKHMAAIEAEQGIKLIFHNNRYERILDQFREDQFDFGYAAVKEYIDKDGVIRIRHAKVDELVTSFSREPDFKDARYIGEVLRLTVEDIRKDSGFDENTMMEIAQLTGSRQQGRDNDFARVGSKMWDDHKVAVLDLEFKSVNGTYFENRVNKAGNPEIRKADKLKPNGNYSKAEYSVIYKCKWVIGTDYIYDFGLATDMKRRKSQLKETSFSYHIIAPSQDQMRFFGIVESMIPVADQIQIMWLKLQNYMLNMVPPGIRFNLDALENINLGHGGEAWKPSKILNLYRQRGDMPFRSRDKDGEQFPETPIEPIQNFVSGEILNMVSIINSFMGLLRDNIGFNEVTDGSTPDPRTLNGVANLAYQNTSNALSSLFKAEKYLNESLADALVVRMQDAFSRGHEGYIAALGGNTLKFWMSKTNITLHELSIIMEDKPSDEQKMELQRDMAIAIESGQITIADKIYIDTIDNLKEKAAVLAFRVKKNQEEAHARSMQQIQANGETQQQSAIIAEQAKQQTMQMEYQLKTQYMLAEKAEEAKIEAMKLQGRYNEGMLREEGRVVTKQVENEGKSNVAAMNQKKEPLK